MGLFEIHITVIYESDDIGLFENMCQKLALKPVLIELPYGETHCQLMTSSWVHGVTTDEAIQQAKDLGQRVAEQGFNVCRIKVEAAASNAQGVPIDEPPTNPKLYFEFHIKVQVEDEELLQQVIRPHRGHLSRNSLKGECGVKFVTVRTFGKGRTEAFKELEALVAELKNNHQNILSIHREFAVYDSNISLDNGWIETL